MNDNYTVLADNVRVPIFMWNKGVAIENEAINQLYNLTRMPFVQHHIAAMPDTHWGVGATVGSVFASSGAIIPAAVGVDIGCGMIAARTNLTKKDLSLPPFYTLSIVPVPGSESGFVNYDLLKNIRLRIECRVPMGRTNNGGKGDRGAWFNIPEQVQNAWDTELAQGYETIITRHPEINKGNTVNHLGTLGTGNHFIEIQYDEENRIWLMLHSGSRGVGNRIGSYFIKLAKAGMDKYFITLPDKDLAYLPEGTKEYGDYILALGWAQEFARINRQLMLNEVFAALKTFFPDVVLEEVINTHHNYAAIENHFGKNVILTRKGAIRARKGDLGIIPGSMGAKSYIVRGLGNPLSFNSCSHGAGRAMSRNTAKKLISLEDHAKATAGIECRKDAEVIDESPAAYKDIDAVIEAEKDLVEVVHTMRQLICCKG